MGPLILWGLVAVLAGGILTLALFSLLSRRPEDLGVREGRLAPCPATPNCVCTFDTSSQHAIAPLAFEGPADAALARLRSILGAVPRARIVAEEGNYLRAEFTSMLFRYVDDVEFLVDPGAKVIHFRSASRAGHSDLGVNRRRMEKLRELFRQKP